MRTLFSSKTFTPPTLMQLNQPSDQSAIWTLPFRLSLTLPTTIERTAEVLAIVGSSATSSTSATSRPRMTHGQRRRRFFGGTTAADCGASAEPFAPAGAGFDVFSD